MKQIIFAMSMTGTLIASSPALAAPISTTLINDGYWGYNDHGYGDVISSASSKTFFNIDHLNVTFDASRWTTVTVYTGFKEGDPRALGTKYGDLFIASSGWNPYVGTDPLHYKQDRLSNTGTQWDFVIDTSEGGALYGGAFTKYQSQDLMSGGTYREGQIVQRRAGGTKLATTAVAFGTELYNGVNYNTITYGFDWGMLGIRAGDELAFKWGMTCANDTIEGRATAVPTAGTLPLFFIGALAFGLWARRSIEKEEVRRG